MSTLDPKNLYQQIKPDEDEDISVSTDDVAMLDENDPAQVKAKKEEQEKKINLKSTVQIDPALNNASGQMVYSTIYNEFQKGKPEDSDIDLSNNPRGVELIKAFQKAENLDITGELNEDTIVRLEDYNKDRVFNERLEKLENIRIQESSKYPSIIDGIPEFRYNSAYWKGKNVDNMTSSEIAVYKDFLKDIDVKKSGTVNSSMKLNWDLEADAIDINDPRQMLSKIEPLGYNPKEFAKSQTVTKKTFDSESGDMVDKDFEYITYSGSGSLTSQDVSSAKLGAKIQSEFGEEYVGIQEMMNYSLTGLDNNTDYSSGYHTIYIDDDAGSVNTVEIVPVPVLYGEIGLDAWAAKHTKVNAKFVPYSNADANDNEWVESIDELNALISKFNNTPASDQVTRTSIAKKINKYHLLNVPDKHKYAGDDKMVQNIVETGIWVPNDNSEFELENSSKVSLWINGKPFSGLAGAKGGVRVKSVSQDGQYITFSGAYGHTVTHNIYDIVNGEVGAKDMEEFYESSKITLGDTFIYSPPVNDAGTIDRADQIRNDPIAQRSLERGEVSYKELMEGKSTSIEKGVLHWINPQDMSIIEDIAAFDEINADVYLDAAGRTVVSLTRGASAPDKIIAEFTDGTSMEVNTEKYKAWQKIKTAIESVRKIEEGVDLDNPNWVNPYQLEKQLRGVQAKIKAFNVMYGDDVKLETRRLYRALLDTYFDRQLDYTVPSADQAYEYYKSLEQWNPMMPPLTKSEFFTYNGWEEGVNPYNPDTFMGEMALKTGRGVKTASDIATQARFLRNLVYYLQLNEFDGEEFDNNRVSEMEEGYNPVLGFKLGQVRDNPKSDNFDPSATHQSGTRSLLDDFRSMEKNWTDRYGQKLLGDDQKDFSEVQSGGSIGIDEYFGIQKMIGNLSSGSPEEAMVDQILNRPSHAIRDMMRYMRDDMNQEDWDELSVARNYYLKEIFMNDEEILKVTQDMNDSGLIPFDILAMDITAQGRMYRSLFSFLSSAEGLVTLPNIVLAKGIKSAYKMTPAGSFSRKALNTTLFSVMTPMVANQFYGTLEELIEELHKDDEQYSKSRVDELWGQIIFDGLMVSPFAYMGSKNMYKRYQMTKTHGIRVGANPMISHDFAMNVKPGGGESIRGVREQLGTKPSAQADAMADIATSSYIATLLKTSEGRAIFERFVQKGKLDGQAKQTIKNILSKDRSKPANADKSNPNIIEDGMYLYDELIRGFMREFHFSKKYPNKDRTDWMHYLDDKFKYIMKGRKGKKLDRNDLTVIRRNLGSQYELMYKDVAKNIEGSYKYFKSKDQGLETPSVPNKKFTGASTKHDYAGNIDLSKLEAIFPGGAKILRQLSDNIGKAVNDEVRFRNTGKGKKTKWSQADMEAVEPSQMSGILKLIMETPREKLSQIKFNDIDFITAKHLLAGHARHLTNNLNKFKKDGTLDQQYEMLAHLWNANQAMVASSGRALNYGKMKMSPHLNTNMHRMMANDYKARLLFDELMNNTQMDASTSTKVIGSIVEFNRNAKLFSLSSWARSIFGNAANSVMHAADKPIAPIFDYIFTNMHRTAAWGTGKVYSFAGKEVPKWAQMDAKQTRFLGESLAYYEGMMKAYRPGAKSIEGGGSVYQNMKAMLFEDVNYLKNDAFYTRERFTADGYLPGWFGKIMRTPQRAQAAIDIFYRQPAENAFLYQMVYRELVKQGLKPGTEKFNNAGYELVTNPSEHFVNKVKRKAEEITFQEELGQFGQSLARFRTGNVSQLSQIWFPFYNTPVNVWKQVYSRTPLASIFSKKAAEGFDKGIKTGHWGDFADVQAKVATGTTATYGMFELMEGIWGEGNVFITGNFGTYDDATKSALEAMQISRNSLVFYDEETELYKSVQLSGWEPLQGLLKGYGAFQGYHGGEFNPDQKFIDKFENYVRAMTLEFTENPMLSGVGDITEFVTGVAEGKVDASDFLFKTARGVFMPNVLSQMGRINDPFYYVDPAYSNYSNELYGYEDDYNILYNEFSREILTGLTGENRELIADIKQLAQQRREEQLQVWKKQYKGQYTDEYLIERLDKVPDMLIASELLDDYTMNLPKLDYFGMPIESRQGNLSLFGFNSYHQEEKRPYWTVSPEFNDILNDKKFWMQAKNKMVKELIRLNVWEQMASDTKMINSTPLSTMDKYLYNAIAGQTKFQFLLDNMFFDFVLDEQGDVKYENGRPLMKLNVDANGNVDFSERWKNDENGNVDEDDMGKKMKIYELENTINPMLLEVGANKIIDKYAFDEDSFIFNPRRDYSFIFGSDEFGGKDFKDWYVDQYRQKYGAGELNVVGNAEVYEAFNQWKAYKELRDKEGLGTKQREFDLEQNYYMLLREFKEKNNILDKYEFKEP